MQKGNKRTLFVGVGFILAFVFWTVLICTVDVQAIGPQGSKVGLATINGFFCERIGVNTLLYEITDWLGLVPIAVALGFAVMGLVQWIKRKSLLKVDRSLFILGGFYLCVIAVYALFEVVVINYRPTLIEGILETSYPSSTTLLVLCVMPTAVMQTNERIKNGVLKKCVAWLIVIFTAFTVIGRFFSGVHWFSDIFGGMLFSVGLVVVYFSLVGRKGKDF